MDYRDYQDQSQQAARFVEAGDYRAALDVLQQLLASDISDLDKSMMCLNMAIIYDKLQQPSQCLRCYDEGMAYEARHGRFFVAEQKAAYLLKSGNALESSKLFSRLLQEPSATEQDKERLRQNERIARDGIVQP